FLDLNYPKFNAKKQSKWQALRFLTTQLNIDSHQVFNHGNQRGIYCGWTGTNAKEFLLRQRADFNKDKLQPVDEIATFWKVRWAKQRSAHLNRDRT
ncbi:unnamed protein product, partial [Rotaria magnacalcarata]